MRTSTRELGSRLNLSQQSVSRLLRAMEKKGLVSRSTSPLGVVLSLDKKGITLLEEEFTSLKRIFEKRVSLEGRAVDGFGEGKYYVRQYSDRFKEKLGFRAYPGTLNVVVDEIKAKEFVKDIACVSIEEFKSSERSFGAVSACPVRINNSVNGAIILPERTRHPPDIIELVAPVCIRESLGLSSGEMITLS